MDDLQKAVEIKNQMVELLKQLAKAKPDERSELARRYAVTITELEKVVAYYSVFVLNARYPHQEVGGLPE